MTPTQPTDRVDDFIHLLQGHSVRLPVEFIEVRFDLFIVVGVDGVDLEALKFVFFIGTKRLTKRRLLDAYIEKTDAV